MADPVVMFDGGRKFFKENFSVSIIEKDFDFSISPSGDVVERARIGDA